MRKIYKSLIDYQNPVCLELSNDFKILHFEHQNQTRNVPTLWFETDPDAEQIEVWFEIFGTGADVPSTGIYRGTAVGHPFVWHLYQISHYMRGNIQ